MQFIPATTGAARARLSSDLVLANGFGFISDLLPIDLADDRAPLPEGVEAQTARIFANLETLLRAHGLTKDCVVQVRVSLVEMPRLYARLNAAYAGFFAEGRRPARSCVGVLHLGRGAQVAMDFVLCTAPA